MPQKVTSGANSENDAVTNTKKNVLPAMKKKINTRAVMVSGTADGVSAEEMYNHLKSNACVHPVSVKLLKRKQASQYAGNPFYIEVIDVDFDNLLFDEDLWDSEIVVREFSGKINPNQVIQAHPRQQ